MATRRYRFFLDPILGQEKWLNEMASKGFRLVRLSNWGYFFEECAPKEYTYIVDIVADKSKREASEYIDFLEELGLVVFKKNINYGKLSLGYGRMRFYGKKGISFGTAPGNVNKELLIIEKKNDGLELNTYSSVTEKITFYENVQRSFLTADVIFALLLLLGVMRYFGYDFGIIRMSGNEIFNGVVVSLVSVLILILTPLLIRYSLIIGKLKQEGITRQ